MLNIHESCEWKRCVKARSQWVWLSLSPQSCPKNCSMEDISGVILNWFNPQQQQHRYSITIKLKHMRPSCYSRCKQKKKNRKQWIWFHPWTRYICCFLFYVLKQKQKKLPQSVLCGYFVHHFFLKVASISFFKNKSLCVRANATHWIHNLQNPLYRQFMDSFTKLSTDSIQSRSSPPPRPWLMDTGWYRSALMCKLLRFQTPPPPGELQPCIANQVYQLVMYCMYVCTCGFVFSWHYTRHCTYSTFA